MILFQGFTRGARTNDGSGGQGFADIRDIYTYLYICVYLYTYYAAIIHRPFGI